MIWWTVFFLLSIAVVGCLRIITGLNYIRGRRTFAEQFLTEIDKYIEGKGEDISPYEWLVMNSPRMQSDLGGIGIAGHYKPPYANYMISNYEIVLNVLPELRQAVERRSSQIAYGAYMMLKETILRYLGVLNTQSQGYSSRLRNPFIWFFEGIGQVLSVPFRILQWAGLISSTFVSGLENNTFYKIASGLAGVISFVSAIVTIVDGWDSVALLLHNIQSSLQ